MSSIFSSATPESPHTSPLSPVERAALRVAEAAAISPAGFRDLTQAIVLELRAAGLLVVPANRSADTEYECPMCNQWARWTNGRSLAAGDMADELWCQSCGATVYLAICNIRPAALNGENERLKLALAREERDHGATIDQRDVAQELADKLAYAIASEEVIGEHSSDNCPWENALDLVTPAAEVDRLKARVAELTKLLSKAQAEARTAITEAGA